MVSHFRREIRLRVFSTKNTRSKQDCARFFPATTHHTFFFRSFGREKIHTYCFPKSLLLLCVLHPNVPTVRIFSSIFTRVASYHVPAEIASALLGNVSVLFWDQNRNAIFGSTILRSVCYWMVSHTNWLRTRNTCTLSFSLVYWFSKFPTRCFEAGFLATGWLAAGGSRQQWNAFHSTGSQI